MHFATAYHRVCRYGNCRMVPMPLRGLGDTIDTSDPCAVNPNDPVCIQFYGGRTAAEQAAVASAASSSAGGLCATDAECADGYTCNAATGSCEPIGASTGGGSAVASWWNTSILNPSTWGSGSMTVPQMPATQAAAGVGLGKVSWKFMLAVALVGGAAYGGIRYYEKRKRRL